MIKLTRFSEADFERMISWIDNEELLLTIAGTDFTFPLTSHQLLPIYKTEKVILLMWLIHVQKHVSVMLKYGKARTVYVRLISFSSDKELIAARALVKQLSMVW